MIAAATAPITGRRYGSEIKNNCRGTSLLEESSSPLGQDEMSKSSETALCDYSLKGKTKHNAEKAV
jgi:hypothetical protein